MGRAIGFIGLLIALAIGAYLYTKSAQTSGAGNATTGSAVDVTSVRNHLMSIANAERRYAALKGGYGSLSDLIANGDLPAGSESRRDYSFTVEYSDTAFRAVATYQGKDPGAPRTLSVDQTMRITVE